MSILHGEACLCVALGLASGIVMAGRAAEMLYMA